MKHLLLLSLLFNVFISQANEDISYRFLNDINDSAKTIASYMNPEIDIENARSIEYQNEEVFVGYVRYIDQSFKCYALIAKASIESIIEDDVSVDSSCMWFRFEARSLGKMTVTYNDNRGRFCSKTTEFNLDIDLTDAKELDVLKDLDENLKIVRSPTVECL